VASMSMQERLRQRLMRGDFDPRGKGGNFLSLKQGKNYVRILPPKSLRPEEDDFYIQRLRHFGVGPNGRSETCPKSKKGVKECCVCSQADKLFKKGDKKAAARFNPRNRYIMNAAEIMKGKRAGEFDVAEEAAIFDAPVTIMKDLATYIDNDEEWGPPWSKDCGRKRVKYDFVITKTGERFNTEYSVQPTTIFKRVGNSKALLSSLHDLEDLFPIPEPEEMEQILLGEDDEDDGFERKSSKHRKSGKRSHRDESSDASSDASSWDDSDDVSDDSGS